MTFIQTNSSIKQHDSLPSTIIHQGSQPADRFHSDVWADRTDATQTPWVSWLALQSEKSRLNRLMVKPPQSDSPIQIDTDCQMFCPTISSSQEAGTWLLYSRRKNQDWPMLAVNLDDPQHAVTCLDDSARHANPRMGKDSQGNLHAVWEKHTQKHTVIRYATYKHGRWQTPVDVSACEGVSYDPVVTIDHSGGVWIAYTSRVNGRYDVYLFSPDGKTHRISHLPDCAYYPSITADPNGGVWIAFIAWSMPFSSTEPPAFMYHGHQAWQRRFFGQDRMIYIHHHDGKQLGSLHQPAQEERLRQCGMIQGTQMCSRPTIAVSQNGTLHLVMR